MNSIIYSVLVGSLLGFPTINQSNGLFGAVYPGALNKSYYADSQTSPTPCTTSSTAPTPTPSAPVHLEYNGLILPSLDEPLPAPKGNDTEEEKKKKEEASTQSNQADQEKTESNIISEDSVSNSKSSTNDSPVSTKGFPDVAPQTSPPESQQPPAQSEPQQVNQQWSPFKPGAFITYNLDNKPVTPIALGGPQTYTIVPTKEEQAALAAKNKAAAEASKKAAQDNGLKSQQGQQSQPGQPLPQLQPQQGQQGQQKILPQQGQQPRPQQFLQGQQQPNPYSNFLNMPPTYLGQILGGKPKYI